MLKLKNIIENQDLFGVPVQFEFNKKGSEHKTVVGGCLSLLIRSLLLIYTIILVIRMVSLDDNKNESYDIKNESFLPVTMGETGIKL